MFIYRVVVDQYKNMKKKKKENERCDSYMELWMR